VKPTGYWFPIHVADYMADTMHLDTEEHGMYLLLLIAYWRRGGPLPDDPKFLAKVCHLSPKRFSFRFHGVSRLFSKVDGHWRHDFMENQILKYSLRHAKAVLAGSSRSTHDQPSLDKKISNKEERKNILSEVGRPPSARKAIIYDLAFEGFWKAYPDRRNNSKPAAFKEWQKLTDEDQRLATESLAAFSAYCRSQKDYRVVHCERYLRDRRFEGWGDRPARVEFFRV
jgi:uncharacterized protein YdaU (DUF1376 family)